MDIDRNPKSGWLVVWPSETRRDELLSKAGSEFAFAELKELPGAFLAHTLLPKLSNDDLREKLYELLGPNTRVLEALEDSDGHMLLPTGNFSIVLLKALSSSSLEKFARRHNLQIISRSKWRPRALIISVAESEDNNPERVIEELMQDPLVDSAQQQVLTWFERSDRRL